MLLGQNLTTKSLTVEEGGIFVISMVKVFIHNGLEVSGVIPLLIPH